MRGNVVIVDDEDETAALLAEMMSSRGFTAIGVTTAHACLVRVSVGDVDVVVADVLLAGTSGLALCRELRSIHPGMRVLLMSGQLVSGLADEANAAGAFDYLTKPIQIDDLDRAVTHAFEVSGRMRAIAQGT